MKPVSRARYLWIFVAALVFVLLLDQGQKYLDDPYHVRMACFELNSSYACHRLDYTGPLGTPITGGRVLLPVLAGAVLFIPLLRLALRGFPVLSFVLGSIGGSLASRFFDAVSQGMVVNYFVIDSVPIAFDLPDAIFLIGIVYVGIWVMLNRKLFWNDVFEHFPFSRRRSTR